MLKINASCILLSLLSVNILSCVSVNNLPSDEQMPTIENTATSSDSIMISPTTQEQKEQIPRTEFEHEESTKAVESPSLEEDDTPKSNIFICAGKTPAQIKKNGSFKTVFSATITNESDGSPVVGETVVVTYPSSRVNDTVQFSTEELLSDINGNVTFESPDTSFACKSEVVFSVASGDGEKSVSIPYLVTTNRFNWGGTISILDYTKSGRPVRDNSLSASAILTAMIRRGFSGIGLADFVNEINSGDEASVYKAAYELIGNNSSFLVFGTVRYDGDIMNDAGLYKIPLVADITCLEMKTGVQLYHTTVHVTGTGNSEWAALNNARTELLAPTVADRIIYGL